MVTARIQLTEEQAERLTAQAAARGLSLEQYLEVILRTQGDQSLADLASRYARARRLIGTMTDPEGKTDLSVRHDAYAWDPAS